MAATLFCGSSVSFSMIAMAHVLTAHVTKHACILFHIIIAALYLEGPGYMYMHVSKSIHFCDRTLRN